MANVSTNTVKTNRYLKPIAFGLIAGFIVTILSLVVFAFIMAYKDIPQSLISTMAVVAAGLGGFVSGFTSAKLAKNRGLFIGAVTGVIISVVILLSATMVLKESIGILALTKFVVVIVSASIGGIMGVNSRQKRRKK
ncbi:MAG: hypothetical protein K0R90_1156 [Oscillospiraceae bacterium]|jgi:putative membrane protein (TIGR04086 family)|nr:hypothetical protein [Oscillospiraceae bacterium]